MNKLNVLIRAPVPLTALVVLLLTLLLGWEHSLLTISVGLLGLDIYDWLQPHSNLARNYPVAARIRALGFDLRPFLRQYIVEDDLKSTPL